jgi:hypothetical protein
VDELEQLPPPQLSDPFRLAESRTPASKLLKGSILFQTVQAYGEWNCRNIHPREMAIVSSEHIFCEGFRRFSSASVQFGVNGKHMKTNVRAIRQHLLIHVFSISQKLW